MVSMAFLATLINYLDRQTLSVVADDLCRAFGMNNEKYGLMISAFMLAYTISNGLSGPLIDRVGTRLGYALCMFVWSTAGILHFFAAGPISLGACRFMLGAGEAGNWPAGVKVVSEWFPSRERALASGIFNSGAALGAVIAPPTIVVLALRYGWRSAFLVIGALGYLWLILWLAIYRTPANVQREVRARPAAPWSLLRTRFLASFTLSKVFMDPVWYFYIFFFPKYLSDVHHFDLKKVGYVGWIPFLTAAAGNFLGGWVAGLLISRGVSISRARKMSVSMFALLMTSAIPAAFTSNVWVAIGLISTATLGYTGYLANALAFPAEVFPKNMVGSIWGLASMGSGFGGMLFGWISGRVIDHLGYVPVFIGYGVMPVISLGCILLWMGELKPDARFANSGALETFRA
jgi:ACS family hexuronate transporter-like MFS transporter